MASKTKAKDKSKSSKKKEQDIEAMLEEDEEDDEDEEEEDDELEEEDEEEEDEEEDEEDEEEDEEDEEEDEEDGDEDEAEELTPEIIGEMKKADVLELIEEEKLKVKKPKGTKLADLKVADLRKRTIDAIDWGDEEEEDDDEDEEEDEKPKRGRSTTSLSDKLGTNPKVSSKAMAKLVQDNPAREGTKKHGFIRAISEKPRTIEAALERAKKQAKKWGNAEGDYSAVADARLIGELRAKDYYIEHDEDDNTFHLLGRTGGGSSSAPTKEVKKKKKKAK